MNAITVEHEPAEEKLQQLGVRQWPIWTHEAAEFPWSYDEKETCFLLEGEVVVTPDNPDQGDPASFGPGDLVTFAQGLSCTWIITKPVKKHYSFG